ncbi:MAG: hypothetical protein ACI97A_004316 [Planctomycetota bacterium]|jgi:hypothetical protein
MFLSPAKNTLKWEREWENGHLSHRENLFPTDRSVKNMGYVLDRCSRISRENPPWEVKKT